MLRQDGPLHTPLSGFTTLTLIRLQVLRSCLFEPTVHCWFIIGPDRQRFSAWRVWYIVELGGMTKNVYHGIFLNYTGFTVYDGIIFFHA